MCGILFILCKKLDQNQNLNDIFQIFKGHISRRGPDSLETLTYTTAENICLLFAASVLWLQGKTLTRQPIANNKAVFVYNGDIFKGIPDECRSEGDTQYIFDLLTKVEPGNIHNELYKLQGPYAFIFYDKLNNKIYFGRDKFGRRSLLIGKNNKNVILCSVAQRTKDFEFIELPSVGTFIWDLKTNSFALHPFIQNDNFKKKVEELEQFLEHNIIILNTEIVQDQIFYEPSSNPTDMYKSLENMNIDDAVSLLLNNKDWMSKVTTLHSLLTDSIRRRISSQPKFCKICIKDKLPCNHCTVGVLFSGGVDCSILALLSDQFVEKDRPIDLFNVAFDETKDYKTPDRLTGLETFQELQNICPDREWRFNEVNITKLELDERRHVHIVDLIYPLKSVLDDSLGCALWFASRGVVDSNCRVLLVGMGADELFGGYTKHRAAFKRASWSGLHEILIEDWQNLPYRNLGRDDRVVSDHGRQLRTPYLDEQVVNYVRGLQCWEKTCPSDKLRHGFGDKILLRSLAYHLGLKKAAFLKKRALQFGSRIANSKEVANEVSSRLC
ncbi:unnamed protein product [Diabrotica balteata]|uniref:Glutamine amidotransferase type-2 domain-containing protein n=1 Tax=Diabrotica balteata TaxID=107213 RepID=A0A9N9XC40_DIABA|nr:unnamed protein product [Diabrotica balteata]